MFIDSLAKLNIRLRNTISVALALLVAVATYNGIVAPHVTQLHAAQQYETVVKDIEQKNKVLSSAVKLKRKKLEQLHQQFGQLQGTLFMVDQASEFFSDLQTISEQAGCAVYSLNFVTDEQNPKTGQSEDNLGLAHKSAMLGVIGMYSDIIKLMERLKARPQKVWIDSFRMTTLEDGSGRLKCDITITVWTIPDKEAVPNE